VGQGLSTYYTNTAATYTLPAGTYTITFRPVSGFTTPPNLTLVVTANQTASVIVNYTSGGPLITSGTIVGSNFQLTVGATSGQKIALERSTDLVHWTAVVTNTAPANGAVTFSDSISSTAQRAVFYRARVAP